MGCEGLTGGSALSNLIFCSDFPSFPSSSFTSFLSVWLP